MVNQKEDNFSLSVFLYVFNKDMNKVLLIKRNKEKRKKWGFDWGTIGGKVEPEELLVEAGIREAKEEIGINLNHKRLKFLFFEERPSKVHTPAVHFFYYLILDEKTKITINQESDEYKWFDLNNLPKKMVDSKEKVLKIFDLANKNVAH